MLGSVHLDTSRCCVKDNTGLLVTNSRLRYMAARNESWDGTRLPVGNIYTPPCHHVHCNHLSSSSAREKAQEFRLASCSIPHTLSMWPWYEVRLASCPSPCTHSTWPGCEVRLASCPSPHTHSTWPGYEVRLASCPSPRTHSMWPGCEVRLASHPSPHTLHVAWVRG